MPAHIGRLLDRWTDAGILDDATAARIRAFEAEHADSGRLRWPILVALAFGALMLASGVLLFVSAHWDALSPQVRMGLVVLLVALFHVIGALVSERFPGMSATLHAIGTAALGGGIFLAGQIFNLDEHWPGGLMLWALGAAIGWGLLRQLPQLAFSALLVPAWLGSEWYVATNNLRTPAAARVLYAGAFLLSLAYFTAPAPARNEVRRHVLLWIGALALAPVLLLLAFERVEASWSAGPSPPTTMLVTGWTVALVVPLAVAAVLHRQSAWPMAAAALWVVILFSIDPRAGAIWPYAWWAAGAIGLVAWGVQDRRGERINMGAAIFAATVTAFYFSEVMDKLGRSASLVGLGVLFLAGGWALERVRRRLVLQVRGHA